MKDYFVSYNKADRSWAEWIAWQLEEAGYTTVLQAWDFSPGSNFVLEMQRAAAESERTIAVVSPDYLRALFTQPEWAAAFGQDPTGEAGKLLPIRVRECELTGLLSQIVYVDLAAFNDELAARQALLRGVKRGRRKPSKPPPFPPPAERSVPARPPFPGLMTAAAAVHAEVPAVRASAVRALANSGAEGIQTVIAALEDEDYEVRMAAAEVLWELAHFGDMGAFTRPAVAGLIAALRDKHNDEESWWDVRDSITAALAEIGSPAVEPTVTLLKDADVDVRRAALDVLTESGDPRAVKALAATLHDEGWGEFREEVLWPLKRMGPTAVPVLLEALKDEDEVVAESAVEVLSGIGDPDAVEGVKRLLEDKETTIGVRRAAADILGRMGSASVVRPLIAALKDEHPQVRRAAAEALARLGKKAARAVPDLVKALEDKECDVRVGAAVALEKVDPTNKKAVLGLKRALTDGSVLVRARAALALARISPEAPDIVAALAGALKHPENEIRAAAAKALKELGPRAKAAVPALAEALKDPSHFVHRAAADALGEIGSGAKVAIPALIAALGGAEVKVVHGGLQITGKTDLLQSAAAALAKIGSASVVVPALSKALKSENPAVRYGAAKSLEQMGKNAKGAVQQLKRAIKDDNEAVRYAASAALRRIHGW